MFPTFVAVGQIYWRQLSWLLRQKLCYFDPFLEIRVLKSHLSIERCSQRHHWIHRKVLLVVIMVISWASLWFLVFSVAKIVKIKIVVLRVILIVNFFCYVVDIEFLRHYFTVLLQHRRFNFLVGWASAFPLRLASRVLTLDKFLLSQWTFKNTDLLIHLRNLLLHRCNLI